MPSRRPARRHVAQLQYQYLNACCMDTADMAYESDITLFLKKLKGDRPELEADQRRGRAIWWDAPPLELDRRRQELQSRVPQQAYPYQTQR